MFSGCKDRIYRVSSRNSPRNVPLGEVLGTFVLTGIAVPAQMVRLEDVLSTFVFPCDILGFVCPRQGPWRERSYRVIV